MSSEAQWYCFRRKGHEGEHRNYRSWTGIPDSRQCHALFADPPAVPADPAPAAGRWEAMPMIADRLTAVIESRMSRDLAWLQDDGKTVIRLDAEQAGWHIAHLYLTGDVVSGLPPLAAAPPSAAREGEALRLLRETQDAMHADLVAIMAALGIEDYARPYSHHEVVVREILPAIQRLAASGEDR